MPPPDITERTEMNGMQLSRNTHIPICDNSKKPTIKTVIPVNKNLVSLFVNNSMLHLNK